MNVRVHFKAISKQYKHQEYDHKRKTIKRETLLHQKRGQLRGKPKQKELLKEAFSAKLLDTKLLKFEYLNQLKKTAPKKKTPSKQAKRSSTRSAKRGLTKRKSKAKKTSTIRIKSSKTRRKRKSS